MTHCAPAHRNERQIHGSIHPEQGIPVRGNREKSNLIGCHYRSIDKKDHNPRIPSLDPRELQKGRAIMARGARGGFVYNRHSAGLTFGLSTKHEVEGGSFSRTFSPSRNRSLLLRNREIALSLNALRIFLNAASLLWTVVTGRLSAFFSHPAADPGSTFPVLLNILLDFPLMLTPASPSLCVLTTTDSWSQTFLHFGLQNSLLASAFRGDCSCSNPSVR
jgi:hypothetical protein